MSASTAALASLLGSVHEEVTEDPGPPLGGNSRDVINFVGFVVISTLAFLTLLGRAVDFWCFRRRGRKFRCRAWVAALLVPCYICLIPGLTGCLFSFNMLVEVYGIIRVGVGLHGGIGVYPATTESMLGLVHLLATTGSQVGAIAVVFYAIVIPSAKLLLMLLGEGIILKTEIQICIQIVQNISKWACPDMFAYILLCYLVRALHHPPMIQARMDLDIGFTCFSLFCVGSTVASLGIRVKDRLPRDGCLRRLAKKIGSKYLIFLCLILLVAFAVLLFLGCVEPVMALDVDMDKQYQPTGPLPTEFMGMPVKPMVDQMGIDKLARAQVTVLEATKELWNWMLDGEVNAFISFLMMAVFVLGMTVADVLLLTATALFLHVGRRSARPMHTCWYLKKLGMLDVMIVGVVVVTLCCLIYREEGIIVSTRPGLVRLMGAEMIHYFMYYLVKAAVENNEKKLPYDFPGGNGIEISDSDTSPRKSTVCEAGTSDEE